MVLVVSILFMLIVEVLVVLVLVMVLVVLVTSCERFENMLCGGKLLLSGSDVWRTLTDAGYQARGQTPRPHQ